MSKASRPLNAKAKGRLVCGNLFIFPGMFGNVLTFPCLVGDLKPHSREYCIPGKEFHPQNITTSPHGNPTFPWEGNVCHCKKTKIPLSSPKATRHRSPPTTAATAGHPPPPPLAALHRRRRWPLATLCRHRPVTCHHLPQGYFWKFVNYSQEFNLHTKHS